MHRGQAKLVRTATLPKGITNRGYTIRNTDPCSSDEERPFDNDIKSQTQIFIRCLFEGLYFANDANTIAELPCHLIKFSVATIEGTTQDINQIMKVTKDDW